MYSIDLSKITLDGFQELLLSIDLLPSRKVLLDGLDEKIGKLKEAGFTNLSDLFTALKSKSKAQTTSEATGIPLDYLNILRREIGSYESKPVKLTDLDFFTKAELAVLESRGIKNTKQFFEAGLTEDNQRAFIEKSGITMDRFSEAFSLVDLLRINGVGPVYAKMLYTMGIHGPKDYLERNPEEVLELYTTMNESQYQGQLPALGMKDAVYCQRFCRLLD